MVSEIFRFDCSHNMLSLNDDDDDTKALPTGVPKDDAMKKGGWGGQNVSKSDDVILVCSLRSHLQLPYILKVSLLGTRGPATCTVSSVVTPDPDMARSVSICNLCFVLF